MLTPAPYIQSDGDPLDCWYQVDTGEEQHMIQTCGHIAALQFNSGPHFLAYQTTSRTQEVLPWSHVLIDDRVCSFQCSWCSCGLQETGRSYSRAPACEQALLVSSCWELVWPFRNCKCWHDPRHMATRGKSHVYLTWDEAQRITEGIRYLLESNNVGHSIVPVYPNF